ncbi:hypothetical protein G6F42_028548 [Rhizopus arrhizus]|nr:hypothetical protein G6F42_028548 [Rhizopus arrhizus]
MAVVVFIVAVCEGTGGSNAAEGAVAVLAVVALFAAAAATPPPPPIPLLADATADVEEGAILMTEFAAELVA